MNNAVQDLRDRNRKDQDLKSLIAQRVFDQQMREREFEQRQKDQDETRASLKEQREAIGEQRRITAARGLSDDLNIGDVLDPSQTATLRAGNLASNIEHRGATLPSRSAVGFLPTGPSAGPNGAPILATGPMLRTMSRPGNPAQDVYRGNRSQRAMQSLLDRFPEGSRERGVLEYENATGRNAPSVFMPTPPREPTPHFSLMPTFDDAGRPNGGIKFNTLTGESAPVEVGNLRAPARGQADDPEVPRGVGDYLLTLRSKYGTYDEALAELTRATASIRQAHPSYNSAKSSTALRQMYAQPGGANAFGLAGGDLAALGEPIGSSPAPSTAPKPHADGAMSRAELQAVAQRLGISEQAAEQQANARGIQVR